MWETADGKNFGPTMSQEVVDVCTQENTVKKNVVLPQNIEIHNSTAKESLTNARISSELYNCLAKLGKCKRKSVYNFFNAGMEKRIKMS
jgi:hypothetical protein